MHVLLLALLLSCSRTGLGAYVPNYSNKVSLTYCEISIMLYRYQGWSSFYREKVIASSFDSPCTRPLLAPPDASLPQVCIIIRASPRDNLSRGCMALESLAYLNSDAHFTFVYPISLAPEEARRRYIDTVRETQLHAISRCKALSGTDNAAVDDYKRQKRRQEWPC